MASIGALRRTRNVGATSVSSIARQDKIAIPEVASFVALPTLLPFVTALVLATPRGRLVLLPLHSGLLGLLRQVLRCGFLRGRPALRCPVLALCLGCRMLDGRLLRRGRRTLSCGLLPRGPAWGRPVLPLSPR